MRSPRLTVLGILLTLASLYLIVCTRIDVGYFNDDARYITAAQALGQGHYDDLELPGHPPQIDRLPGYPIFLLPFVRVLEPHWPWLKMTSILLTILSCLLLYVLYEDCLTRPGRFLLMALFGLNPTIMKYSCSVMSEPCFLFFTLLTFVLFKKGLERKKAWLLWISCLTLTWAVLIRPEGVALYLAFPIALALNRQWRRSLLFLLVPLFVLTGLLLRTPIMTSAPAGYIQQVAQTIAYMAGHYGLILKNIGSTFKVLFVDAIFQGSFPMSPMIFRWIISGLLCLTGIVVAIKGFCLESRAAGTFALLNGCIGIFAAFYLIMHGVFLSVNSRYFFTLIPFVLAWLIAGAWGLAHRFPHPRRWIGAGASGLLFLYGNPWSSASDKVFAGYSYRIPRQTFSWIQKSTDPDAFLLAIKASTVHLYTGRFSVSEIQTTDLEEFRYELLRNGITHLLITPTRVMVLEGKDFRNMLTFWETARQWVPAWPEAFEQVYENSPEGTALFRVIPDQHYQDAYAFCRAADADFIKADWKAGIAKLDRALALFPHFPGALNRYGMAILFSNGNRELARQKFLRAIEIHPDFSFALLNVSKMYRRDGKNALAQKYLADAEASLKNGPSWSGDSRMLMNLIRMEAASVNEAGKN